MSNSSPPIIFIRKARKKRHEPHGGAWKVAMADFALAMMALFLVLWVVSSSNEDQKVAISGYFQDPLGFTEGTRAPSPYVIDLGGSPTALSEVLSAAPDQPSVDIRSADTADDGTSLDQRRWQEVKQVLESQVFANPTLDQFEQQLKIDITDDGLTLQLVDRQQSPMFSAGGETLSYLAEDLLWELGPILANMNYVMALIGHTDAAPMMGKDAADDGNWGLSASRADAARRALMEAGVRKEQIAHVMGVGDTIPLDPNQPDAAINRRIAITLLRALPHKADKQDDFLDIISDSQKANTASNMTDVNPKSTSLHNSHDTDRSNNAEILNGLHHSSDRRSTDLDLNNDDFRIESKEVLPSNKVPQSRIYPIEGSQTSDSRNTLIPGTLSGEILSSDIALSDEELREKNQFRQDGSIVEELWQLLSFERLSWFSNPSDASESEIPTLPADSSASQDVD